MKSRYMQVAETLLDLIGNGEYEVGTNLPTEIELCDMFGVSRYTIREALRKLQSQGIISRRARTGTKVIARTVATGYRQELSSIEDLMQFGRTNVRTIASIEPECLMEDALCRQLDCDASRTWLYLESIRSGGDGGKPICRTENYIDRKYAGVERIIEKKNNKLICVLIEEEFGIRAESIAQYVSTVTLPRKAGSDRNASDTRARLLVIRKYLDGEGGIMLVTRTIYDDPQYRLMSILVRAEGAT